MALLGFVNFQGYTSTKENETVMQIYQKEHVNDRGLSTTRGPVSIQITSVCSNPSHDFANVLSKSRDFDVHCTRQ